MNNFAVIKDLSEGLYFLNGKRQTIDSPKDFPVFEPRSGKIVARCPIADENVVNAVCQSAHQAQKEWAKVTPLERAKILNKVATIIRVSYSFIIKKI
jgi:acyl-CoA reductase-like NAD-dependent aldehyde dehydrogenase